MRFLVSRLSSLGDVVCTLPVAAALKAGYPGCHLVWVVDRRFRSIVDRCTAVDEVVATDGSLKGAQATRLLEPFDAALDMQGLLKSALPVLFARASRKVGYHWQREGSRFFSQRVLPDPSSNHIVDQYVDVARALGGEASAADFALAPTPEDKQSMWAKLGPVGDFVAINPGAGWATKRWPTGHVARLCDLLAERDLRAVLIGGPTDEDRAIAQQVVAEAKHEPVVMTGRTNLVELIALIAKAKAHVGGDTGSTHLAAALGVPAIGLYSITRPARSCPYGQIDRCLYDPTGLAGIAPDAVLRVLQEALP